jgi:hypothetical protein
VIEERQRKQHTADYNRYDSGLSASPSFMFEGSKRFNGWKSLAEAGILTGLVEIGYLASSALGSGTGVV